jgi:CHAT domain-containing protein/tetratricopeptide (TPR) repeat protein
MEHSGFPSDETLAAFIDGRLDAETRRKVIEHMAGCEECWTVYMSASEMPLELLQAANVRGWRRKKSWLLAVAAILALAIFAVPVRIWLISRRSPLQQLAEAAPASRKIEGRFTGFGYQPLAPVTRGWDGSPATDAETSFIANPENWRVVAVAPRIEEQTRENPSAENLHARGVLHLMMGNWDEGLDDLKKALRKETGESDLGKAMRASKDASLLSDLSVAYLERARRNRPEDVARAVEFSSRAWKLARTPETAWNRALALEAHSVPGDVESAWRDYLALDPASKWSVEATSHLRKVSQPTTSDEWDRAKGGLIAAALSGRTSQTNAVVRRFPKESSSLVVEGLLPSWAEAVVRRDDSAASRRLSAAGVIAENVVRVSGDRFADDCVVHLQTIGTEDRSAVAAGLLDVARGRALYNDHQVGQSEPFFRRGLVPLTRAGAPFRYDALLLAASCLYYSNHFAEADTLVTTIIQELDARHVAYPSVRGHAFWIRGSTRISVGRPLEGLADYEVAKNEYSAARDPESLAGLETMMAAEYQDLGDFDAAWRFSIEGLRGMSAFRPSLRSSQLLASASRLALQEHLSEVALLLANRRLAFLNGPDLLDLRVFALLDRATIFDSSANLGAADADRREAIVLASSIPDAGVREQTTTSAAFVRASCALAPEPGLASAANAVAFRRSRQEHHRLSEILLEIGRASRRRGDLTAARSALAEAVDEIEHQRSAMAGELRSAYVDSRRAIYDEAIDLALLTGDRNEAFRLSEIGRARLFGGEELGPPVVRRLDELSAALPLGVAIIEYAVLPDKVVSWLLQAGNTEMSVQPLGRDQLSALVQRFVAQTRGAGDGAEAEQLHELLIGPWLSRMRGTVTVVFIAEQSLLDVPFAALHGRGEPPLIERFAVASAPSVSMFLRQSAVSPAVHQVLVVDPESAAPGLEPLRNSAAEAERVAAAYPGARLLRGADASVPNFRSQWALATSIHYTGHAVSNSRVPSLAALVLRDGPSPAYLYAYEIAATDLRRVRLVVLSACATSSDVASRTEGISSLGRAFMAAGARVVIGTLWPVEDEAASQFSIALHEHLRAGESPVQALRQVQLAGVRAGASRDWAAFAVIGDLRNL